MKIEDQICTAEQAKKLKELGIDQKSSYFKFLYGFWGKSLKQRTWTPITIDNKTFVAPSRILAAFTVAELGIMLPGQITTTVLDAPGLILDLHFGIDGCSYKGYSALTSYIFWGEYEGKIKFPTEAQGRAAMLIWVLENKLVTVGGINENLKNSIE